MLAAPRASSQVQTFGDLRLLPNEVPVRPAELAHLQLQLYVPIAVQDVCLNLIDRISLTCGKFWAAERVKWYWALALGTRASEFESIGTARIHTPKHQAVVLIGMLKPPLVSDVALLVGNSARFKRTDERLARTGT